MLQGWNEHPKEVSLWMAMDLGSRLCACVEVPIELSLWQLVLRSLARSPKGTSWPFLRRTGYSRMAGTDRITGIKSQKIFTLSEYCTME